MNEKVLHTLEFDKIRTQLASHCYSNKAGETALRLSPRAELGKINRLQAETEAAVNRVLKKSAPSFTDPRDMSLFAKRLAVGGILSIGELLSVMDLLGCAGRIKTYGMPEREDSPTDCLTEDFVRLNPLPQIYGEIDRCIISEDEVADDASPTLSDIRRKIKSTASSVNDKLNSLLNSLRDYLQEPVITQRGGRYCLPVAAGYKAKVPGMVHDQSGSGATLFIEPMAVVELNNKLRELRLMEAEEIDAIMATLSGMVAEHIDDLMDDYKILLRLDFIFAKARLALDMNALRPVISEEGVVNLKAARHPLLDKAKCVPIDIRLGQDFDQLVVTGPNTGGKTVSIKTLGLLALMAQAGLHIPAKDGSSLPIFYYIAADIGDEQSIEQSLSTFSSHMTNIQRILKDIDANKRPHKNCLVLFDELCAGTDPSEGAALATSILSFLHERGVRTMATTHYSELKIYALTTPGVENASMEFNVETLSPTYHLIIGAPGKSNAFAISRKLGLFEAIIEDAGKRLSESDISVEELLSQLEERRVQIERAKEEIDRDKEEIANLRENIKKKEARLEKDRDRILEQANAKASNILKDAKDVADAAIRNINKYGNSSPDMAKLEKQRANLGSKLKTTRGKSAPKDIKPSVKGGIAPDKIRIGDLVHVISMDVDGIVQSLPAGKDEIEVQMGILKSRVKLSDLLPVAEKDVSKTLPKVSVNSHGLSKAASISPEIKLLGMTADEAINELSKYLDDAYISRLASVRIVHGKGSGVLRNAVSEFLRKNPVIKSYHLAEYGEGDSGVTIAEFK